MIKTFKLFEYHEENINKILDKINKHGKDSLSDFEKKVLQNQGDIQVQTHFENGNFEFDYEGTETTKESIIVNGTLKYLGDEFHGNFEFPIEIEHESSPDDKFHNSSYGQWNFYDSNHREIEPEDDDFYSLDDLMQEVESVFSQPPNVFSADQE